MIIILGNSDCEFKDTVVTIGKFDALHIGHKALMKHMRTFKEKGLKTVVLRLDIRNGDIPLRTELERISQLEKMGIDIYIRHDFTERDARMSAEDFIKDVIVGKLGAKAVVVGEDFRFGHERRGDAAMLADKGAEFGFATVVIPKVTYHGDAVSSSRIRRAVKEGRTQEAADMLD